MRGSGPLAARPRPSTASTTPSGSLTEVVRDGLAISTLAYDANSNRLSRVTPQGELRSKSQNGQTVTYAYDELGQLRHVEREDGIEIDYLIDGAGRRVGKRVGGVLVQGFLYQGALAPVAEIDSTGAVVSRFVYGSRANVPDYFLRGGRAYRVVTDHLGSPRLVVDTADGSIAQQLEYDEWGKVTLDTNPGFQPFGFAGGLYDRQTGLLRFGARAMIRKLDDGRRKTRSGSGVGTRICMGMCCRIR